MAGLALVVLWAWSLRRPTPDVRTHVSSALPPPGVSLETDEAPAISPDGSRLLFVGHDATGKQLLYTLKLDVASPAQPLAHTDGASLPFWSPDSHSVGFFGQGKLKTLDLETGQIRTLADAGAARGGTWNRDDIIVFAPRAGDGSVPHFRGRRPAHASEDRHWRRVLVPFIPTGRPAFSVVQLQLPPSPRTLACLSPRSIRVRRSGWSPLDHVRFMHPDISSFGGKGRCWRKRSTKQLWKCAGIP